MKALISFAGILLIIGGCYFIYDGYQDKQTGAAKVEKEISAAVRALTNDSVQTKTKVNNRSSAKMIGGGVAGVTGILLLAGGLRRKKN
jgi:heterodisulfide reductase subunit A-like polyferredoxin